MSTIMLQLSFGVDFSVELILIQVGGSTQGAAASTEQLAGVQAAPVALHRAHQPRWKQTAGGTSLLQELLPVCAGTCQR